MERRLAVILAADVVSYSRLMEADEEATVLTLGAYRKIIEKYVTVHSGRVFGGAGDSVIAEFASPVQAVRCAVDIQRELETHNAELPEEKCMRFRIGVNLGDVIVEGDNLLGDGVNVAARIESLGDPGGISLARSVFDQVKKQLDLGYEYLGEHSVKNITDPVAVYRVLTDPEAAGKIIVQAKPASQSWKPVAVVAAVVMLIGAAGAAGWLLGPWAPTNGFTMGGPAALPLPDKPSIAVLPFNNLTGKPDLEYFSDGITEDIITNLAKFSGLLVIDRHSAFQYKSKSVDLKDVRSSLGVRYALEGSLQMAGQKSRITAKLVDTGSGKHLWAERFDFEGTEVFDVRDDILQRISSALMGSDSGFIVRTERQRASEASQDRLSAYDYVMRGWEQWYLFTRESNLAARRFFEQAAIIDPTYAQAYSALAWTYAEAYERDWTDDYEQAVELALEMATKGHELDDTDYRSHWALGWAYLYSWEHDKASEHYHKALLLNQNDAELYAEMSNLLIYIGQPDRAVEHLKLAMRLNPLHEPWYSENLGWAYEEAGKSLEAIAVFEKIREPEEWIRRTLAAAYAAAGETDKASGQVEKILESNPDFSLAAHEDYVRDNFPYQNEELIQRWIEALRKTGAPE